MKKKCRELLSEIQSLPLWNRLFQSALSIIIALSFSLNLISCSPSTTNNYLTAQGADKKLPDDDGYTGSGGTGDGGGGQGILCSSEAEGTQFQSKIFTRDIFEAIHHSKLKIKSLNTSGNRITDVLSSDEIKFLIETLKNYFGLSIWNLEIGNDQFWTDFVKKISFLEDGVDLNPSKDANSPIILPSGCKIVQIAFWDDSSGKSENGVLYVSKKYWGKLDSVNKVALLAHEYFFKEARRAGYKNSDFIRGRIGQIFSESGVKPLFEAWPRIFRLDQLKRFEAESFKFCTGKKSDDPTALLHVYFYNREYMAIPLLRSRNLNISSLQNLNLKLPRGTSLGAIEIAHLTSYFNSSSIIDVLDGYQPSDEKNNLYDINFRLTGDKSSDKSYTENWIKKSINAVSNEPDPVWKVSANSLNSVLQIALANPVSVKTEPTLPSGDQYGDMFSMLAYLIKHESKDFDKRSWDTNSRTDFVSLTDEQLEEEILNLFSATNLEVAEFIAEGKYPQTFPKWDSAIFSLANKLIRFNSSRNIQGYIDSIKLYPTYLYKAKLGILTASEKKAIADALGSASQPPKEMVASGYETYDLSKIAVKNGKMIFKDQQDEVSFDITCEDAGSTYARSLPKTPDDSNNLANSAAIPFEIYPYVYEGQFKASDDEISQMLTSLSGRPNGDAQLSFCDYFSNDLACSERRLLYGKLRQTSKITVGSCDNYDPYMYAPAYQYRPSSAPKCYLLKFQEDQSLYMVASYPVAGDADQPIEYKYKIRPVIHPVTDIGRQLSK